MITLNKYTRINNEVIKCINATLNRVKDTSPDNYVLYLANAEYIKVYDENNNESGHYRIDDRIENDFDKSRLKFLTTFLNKNYTFPEHQTKVEDDEYRLHIELTVYTHIWESKTFLKQLYRLAHLDNLEPYCWDVNVPEMSKHDFIRNNVKIVLKNNKNRLSSVIEKGFHTSLRNAFAHSEYSFDTTNGYSRIWLGNYKGKDWELSEITFDDWSERFAYSVLLSYHLLIISDQHRRNLIKELGTDVYSITYPPITDRKVEIKYRPDTNEFIFKW